VPEFPTCQLVAGEPRPGLFWLPVVLAHLEMAKAAFQEPAQGQRNGPTSAEQLTQPRERDGSAESNRNGGRLSIFPRRSGPVLSVAALALACRCCRAAGWGDFRAIVRLPLELVIGRYCPIIARMTAALRRKPVTATIWEMSGPSNRMDHLSVKRMPLSMVP
jgi:hypothetical protein